MARKKPIVANQEDNFVPKKFKPMNKAQANYAKAIETSCITFAIGCAGTSKSYTAIAVASQMLKDRRIDKIILTRPIVECGESLGHLPGVLKEKVDPYMKPLYEIFKDFFSVKEISDMEQNEIIELCPLAFMRGRSLKNCVVIADETQNATYSQILMLLTRLDENCRIVINGDPTQSDLNHRDKIPLITFIEKLKDLHEISVVRFHEEDIVRHSLISKILLKMRE